MIPQAQINQCDSVPTMPTFFSDLWTHCKDSLKEAVRPSAVWKLPVFISILIGQLNILDLAELQFKMSQDSLYPGKKYSSLFFI